MKLYHGSNIEVSKPEIRPSKFTKDFGVGFYCTRLKRQAKRWACRKTPSVISEYEFIRKSELSVKVFSNMTDEWLDFIVSCRRGYTHNYDIVIGPMANDQVYNYVEDFAAGIITRTQFWALAEFKYPTHQVCFATEESLSSLKFLSSQTVDSHARKRT